MASVYLMKNMASGYYKIGASRQPRVPERTLRSEEPDIRLLASVEADPPLERELHRRVGGHGLVAGGGQPANDDRVADQAPSIDGPMRAALVLVEDEAVPLHAVFAADPARP